jgi:rSAM/selenodomain-associated transferase 1
MKQPRLLVVFSKNAVRGTVKTRLAATVGADTAFEVFCKLLHHTQSVVRQVRADKIVYYTDTLEDATAWGPGTATALQQGDDLGERMRQAFAAGFRQGYVRVVIIGTDCPNLDAPLLDSAFGALDTAEVVIGPAFDGGYYLLGMKTLHEELFRGIAWSTSTVYTSTLEQCRQAGLSYTALPLLHDIDEEADLVHLDAVRTTPELLFVYNAAGDLFSTLTDFAHKLLSPSTYTCALCALTWGNFTMKQEWKAFVRSLPLPVRFLYKDEWAAAYGTAVALPAVYLHTAHGPEEIISPAELQACPGLGALQTLVSQKVDTYVQHHHTHL